MMRLKRVSLILAPIILSSAVMSCASDFQSAGKAVDDSMITSKARVALTRDMSLKSRDLKLKTKSGVVYITGVVESEQQKKAAIADIRNLRGVKKVDSTNLFVRRSNTPVKDAAITAQLRGKILKKSIFQEQDIKQWPISIRTTNGVVTLSGKVPNYTTRQDLIDMANSIDRVHSVKASSLRISY